MAATRSQPAPALAGKAPPPTQPAMVAKGALRRLAQAQLEPTPENYARAYAEEAGQPPPAGNGSAAAAASAAAAELKQQGQAWAGLAERLVRELERGGRQWTGARRKESLKRVFDSSRSEPQRLLQRMQSLLAAWESDQASDPTQTGADEPGVEPRPAPRPELRPEAAATTDTAWPALAGSLQTTVRAALPATEPRAAALADQLATLADALATEGPTAERVAAIDALCRQARRMLGQRHRLFDELAALCREMSQGLTELAEDDSWVRGQCEHLQASLADGDGLNRRDVRVAFELLADTRRRQAGVRDQRRAAHQALRQLIHDMLIEVGELGDQAGRFQQATAQHVAAIESADSLQDLAGVVRSLLADARAVQAAVGASQQKLQADRDRAAVLEDKVRELETELRRLSDEVSTDALTQVANRRGLTQAFEALSAEHERGLHATAEAGAPAGAALAVALLDIDNFKRLNDSLGHAAGDLALKTLAAAVRDRLRPADHLARFGGEEFVVLLPATELAEAQQALSRLQRSLSEALFLHEGREVFVTFSAGVTAWRPGEDLQLSLERADEALYEAKRSGKNRTCIA